ncbi:1403_t:CDS:2, partial [Funneliformis mosseae]
SSVSSSLSVNCNRSVISIFLEDKLCFVGVYVNILLSAVLKSSASLDLDQLVYSLINISNLPTAILQITKPGITQPEERSLARLWHEEIKCLFLRCRNPSDAAIESLIVKIFNYELYSSLQKLQEFKEIRTRERQMTAPTNLESKNLYLEIAEKILNRYLKGTNINKLKRCGIMERLALMIREAFKVHYIFYNTKAIKELDNITVDCMVPSRSKKNIASKLSLVE